MPTPEISSKDMTDLRVQETERKAELLGAYGTLHYFENKSKEKVACYLYPAHNGVEGLVKPRAVLHLLHGHGAYAAYDWLKSQGPRFLSTYAGSWVENLNKAGYSVVAIDLHGCGRSEGTRCYTNSFDDYVDDVLQSIQLPAQLNLAGFPPILPAKSSPNALQANGNGKHANGNGMHANGNGNVVHEVNQEAVPRFLMGESMGGCLSTLVSMRLPETISGMVLLAPMLSLEKVSQRGLNKFLKLLAPIMSFLFPKLACAAVANNYLYPDLQEVWEMDPNCWHGKTRARNACEYIRVTHHLMHGGLEKVQVPFLVFHGVQDDMCDIDGSRAIYERAASKDKSLQLLDHMWHILPKEPGNAGLLADIIAWVDERTEPFAGPSGNKDLMQKLRDESEHQLEQLRGARPELIEFFAKGKAARAPAPEPALAPHSQ